MGKSKKKLRDFQKVKLKVGKKLQKPNEVSTIFKAKKVVLLEQLKNSTNFNQSELLSRKKLTLNDLCIHTKHYNVNVRKDAIGGLKEILAQQSDEQIKANLKVIVENLCSLFSDLDADVRKAALAVLKQTFEKVNAENVSPTFHLIVAHLICAATHLNTKIKLFSVKIFETIVETLPTLCKGDWSLLKTYADLLNFREKNVDRAKKATFLAGLVRILDLNYRTVEDRSLIDEKTFPQVLNPKRCSLTLSIRQAPFDCPIVSNIFAKKSFCDEINEPKNMNYLLNCILPFCHSFWLEITTTDNDGLTETTNLFDVDTLRIMMEILKIYSLLIAKTNTDDTVGDFSTDVHEQLTRTLDKYFRNASFLKKYADVFPCHAKRKNVADAEMSDICSTVNLLLCEIATQVISRSEIVAFLQKLLKRENQNELKMGYARNLVNRFGLNFNILENK